MRVLHLYIISISLMPTKRKDAKVTTLKITSLLIFADVAPILLRHAIFGRYHRKQMYIRRGASHFRSVKFC